MNKKAFLISIDTEGDNLWEWKPGKKITTENSLYLERFQSLCDKYGFKPTYLTNYEMAADDRFVSFAKKTLGYSGCEIGMHLHAWNSPPDYELKERSDGIESGCPYLIEYPTDIMEQKIDYLTRFLGEKFGNAPIVHRAGRWAMDERYFKLLDKYGYISDCSVTPGMNWNNCSGFSDGSKGSDYSDFPCEPYIVNGTSVMELPVNVIADHRVRKDNTGGLKHKLGNLYRAFKGYGRIWLRPNGKNLESMLYMAECVYKSRSNYLMFMLHSSEFMPGGSPTFDNAEKIEKLYSDIGVLFERISNMYTGSTIGDFSKKIIKKA